VADRRIRWRALPVAAVLVLTGCAGIPHGGEVHVGRAIPGGGGLGDDVDVRVLPPPPRPGMAPEDVVQGFLRAMVNRDGGYEIARLYLTARAAPSWKADLRVTTYDDGGVRLARRSVGTGTQVRFRAPRTGVIDGRGDFTPRSGVVEVGFGLSRDSGEWRIDRLPDGALLSPTDVTHSYRFADVYYASRSGPSLVPEQVLLPDPGGITTALVRALVSGPGKWLAPAVRTGFPTGTGLLGNVPVDRSSGVAEVNLSAAVRQASDEDLQTMSAQLAWTLRQVQEISSVRLLADGSQLAVFQTQGAPDEWASVDPAPRPSVAAAFFRAGRSWTSVGPSPAALEHSDGLVSVALSRAGDRLAGLRRSGSGVALVVGPAGSAPTERVRGRRMSPPTFGPAGEVYTVVTDRTGRWVARVTADDRLQRVPAASAVTRGRVQQLRISPDGARVAAVVGAVGRGRLLVGRIALVDGKRRFDGFRVVSRGVTDVRGLSWGWTTPSQVVVSATVAGDQRELLAIDANGYSSVTISTAGGPAQPTDVATAPGRPLVVAAAGEIWVDQPSGWRRDGLGAEPRYAG
jgi:hypothetical protein